MVPLSPSEPIDINTYCMHMLDPFVLKNRPHSSLVSCRLIKESFPPPASLTSFYLCSGACHNPSSPLLSIRFPLPLQPSYSTDILFSRIINLQNGVIGASSDRAGARLGRAHGYCLIEAIHGHEQGMFSTQEKATRIHLSRRHMKDGQRRKKYSTQCDVT